MTAATLVSGRHTSTDHPDPRSRLAGLGSFVGATTRLCMAALFWCQVSLVVVMLALAAWNGHRPVLIVSGSMAPSIPTGSVVESRAPHLGDDLLGHVVTFDWAGDRVTHRAVQVDDSGRYTTRGDANPDADSASIELSDVEGVATNVVPFVGLPVIWTRAGEWTLLLTWMAASAIGAWAAWGGRGSHGRPAPRDR